MKKCKLIVSCVLVIVLAFALTSCGGGTTYKTSNYKFEIIEAGVVGDKMEVTYQYTSLRFDGSAPSDDVYLTASQDDETLLHDYSDSFSTTVEKDEMIEVTATWDLNNSTDKIEVMLYDMGDYDNIEDFIMAYLENNILDSGDPIQPELTKTYTP